MKARIALLFLLVASVITASFVVLGMEDGFGTLDVEAAGGGSPSADVYVDDDADAGWYDATHVRTVQEGVDNATAGDTVFVTNGTYYENVVVNKSLRLIGEDKEATIIDGENRGNAVSFSADGATVTGFTVKNGFDGIQLRHVDHCRVEDDIISNNYNGIRLDSFSNNNTIMANTIRNTDNIWEGFSPADLTRPNTSEYERLQATPQEQLPYHPGFVTPSLSITVAPLYARYGGTVKITIPNSGSNDIFVYNAALTIGSDTWRWTDGSEGVEIPSGRSRDIYLAAGDGLSQPGLYDFSLELSFMVNNRAGSIPYEEHWWYDVGSRTYTSFSNLSSLQVRPYISTSNISSCNYYRDFDLAKELINTTNFLISQKAQDIAGPYGAPTGEYNIAMVCAVFDYLHENHTYVDGSGNVWQAPATTLQQGGDCEDYAILFSALVDNMGGMVRVYMNETHAFSGVYIGNSAATAYQVVREIHDYYGTDFYVATVQDDLGYWLVADLFASGFYLGNLPAGGAPVGPPLQDYLYNWDFHNTTAIESNNTGIHIDEHSNYNLLYHNNFVNNTQNARDDGDNIWYNATLQEGNYWSDYSDSDSNDDGIGDTPYNISGGDNQDLFPLMELYSPEVERYTLSASVDPSGSGSVSLNPSGGTYDQATTVTVTASPSSGYEFDQWSGDVSGTSPSIEVTMNEDKSVTAHFTKATQVYISDASAAPGETDAVPVIINTSDADGIGSATIELNYDPAVVEIESVTGDNLGFLTSTINNSNGEAIMTASTGASPGPTGTVSFANVSLRAVGDDGETSPLNLSVTSLYDADAESPTQLAPVVLDGNFTVIDVSEGDPTGDGVIDTGDSQVVKKHIVGTYRLTGSAFDAADVYPVFSHGDGVIDTADVQLIDQHIVGTYTIDPSPDYPDTWTIRVVYAGDYTATNITVRHDPDKQDTDGDGLSDYDEWFNYMTNASNPDTDGDGIPDASEVQWGTDPTDWRHDVDHDNGNWHGDYDELIFYRRHNISNETSLQFLQTDDVDGDGIRDGFDIDPLNDLKVTVTIGAILITSDMDESDGHIETEFQLVTDATAASGGLSSNIYDIIQGQNNTINYEFAADLDDTGTPGEYNNSISLTVIDHDDSVGERKPADAISGDGFPDMDFVRIDGNGSYANDHFDVRSDCHSYALHGADGSIWFTIADASQPYTLIAADADGPYAGVVDAPVQFDASATGGTLPYSYAWDFDDDGIVDSTMEDPSYSYSTAGTYTVLLTVTDDDGSTGTDTTSVDISAGATVTIQNGSAAPGETDAVPVIINTSDADGIGSATLRLNYDSAVVEVDSVTGGDLGPVTSTIDNSSVVTMTASTGASPGPTGTVSFANVTLHAVGSPGDTSPLNLTVTSLYDGSAGSPNPISPVVEDGTFTVSTHRYGLSYSVDPLGSGSISLNPSGGIYVEGTTVTATASPASGYQFDHWSGDASGTSTSTQVTMNEDKSIVAHFTTEPSPPENQPPTVSLASPAAGSTVNGTVTVEGTASDSDGTVESVEVRIDDGKWQTASGTDSWTYSWDTTTVNNGNHTVKARSYDGEDYSDVASVTVEVINNHPPSVSITSPEDGATVNGTIVVTGTATDADGNETITRVEIRIDGGSWMSVDNITSWDYRWNTTTEEDGNYTIEARAYDGIECSDIGSITVTIDNQEEEEGVPGFQFILLLAAAGVALLIFQRRRSRR